MSASAVINQPSVAPLRAAAPPQASRPSPAATGDKPAPREVDAATGRAFFNPTAAAAWLVQELSVHLADSWDSAESGQMPDTPSRGEIDAERPGTYVDLSV